jgi:hypothetical protein
MAKIPYRPLEKTASCILLVGAAHSLVHARAHVVVPHDGAAVYYPPHTSACFRISDTLTTSHHSIWLAGSVRSHMLVAAHLTQNTA